MQDMEVTLYVNWKQLWRVSSALELPVSYNEQLRFLSWGWWETIKEFNAKDEHKQIYDLHLIQR